MTWSTVNTHCVLLVDTTQFWTRSPPPKDDHSPHWWTWPIIWQDDHLQYYHLNNNLIHHHVFNNRHLGGKLPLLPIEGQEYHFSETSMPLILALSYFSKERLKKSSNLGASKYEIPNCGNSLYSPSRSSLERDMLSSIISCTSLVSEALPLPKENKTTQNQSTPWKINMEPENDGLEDDFPFQLGVF